MSDYLWLKKYLSKSELEELYPKKTRLEMHADGVKEVEEREECPFCKPTWCDEPHCPYTPEEE